MICFQRCVYINDIIDGARINKYVETIFGRKRSIWDIDSENSIRKKAAERMAINMPIQGSAAEMIKVAMIAIQKGIKKSAMKSKMILQIHDELLFESPQEEENQLVSSVPLIHEIGKYLILSGDVVGVPNSPLPL